jgi:hypothetical protein
MLFRHLKIMALWAYGGFTMRKKNHGACVRVLYNEAGLALHYRGSQGKGASNQFGFC